MSDEATQLREAIRKIRTEVDCRISHGAESFGHLEYVKEQLDKALAIPVRGCQSGTHEHHQTSMSPELKERINSAIVDPNSIAEEIGEAPCGLEHLRYIEAEFVESLVEELLERIQKTEKDRIAKMHSALEAANLCPAHIGLKQGRCPVCEAQDAKSQVQLATTHVDLLQKDCRRLAEENRRLREAFQMAATHLPLGSEAFRLAQEALSLGSSVEPSADK
jgi:hypothetical protein